MSSEHRIALQVDVGRIIEVLAKQIYQSPFALLRENTQNAFDAILLRRHINDDFEPRIDIVIEPSRISVTDNGIGMSLDDLHNHYWRAGSSGKNTDEARQAGVVGTFGIGAMANFGIADRLTVETESTESGERTHSFAEKATLSTTENTILLAQREPTGSSGTTVVAEMDDPRVDVAAATTYIREFLEYVQIPAFVNGVLASQRAIEETLPAPPGTTTYLKDAALTPELMANLRVVVANGTGEVWIHADALRLEGAPVDGILIVRQGAGSIRTFRSGFGLATVGVSSQYAFGGLANVRLFEPTAGREALTTASTQFLQSIVTALDSIASEEVASRPEADLNTAFSSWVRHHGRYDLCGQLKARVEPDGRQVRLADLRDASAMMPLLVYAGADPNIIQSAATDERGLVVLPNANPRRACVSEYLTRFCRIETLANSPQVLNEKPPREWTIGEQAAAFRIEAILESDYFLPATVGIGKLSHGLPVLLTESNPARLIIDAKSSTFATLIRMHDAEFHAFGSMAKDVVRNVIFPKVSDLVPSSTRQGAEIFLRTIRRPRDLFEYEYEDLDALSSIWDRFRAGEISVGELATRTTAISARNVQVLDAATARPINEVLPDVVDNEATIHADVAPGAAPPILRTDVESEAKLLTIGDDEPALKGYRSFIALSDRAHDERGEFFFQPHATSVVWGGQRLLFVFEHHSGDFGLYYDLQAQEVVSSISGGGPFPTATIVVRNRIYIPIPDVVAEAFLPNPGQRKKLEVRYDFLYTEGSERHKNSSESGT